MNAVMRRIQAKERWWAAEFVCRGFGLALLALCACAAIWLYRSANQPPAHELGPADYVAALVTFQSWSLGWPFLIEGPGLFKLVTLPRTRGPISFTTQGQSR